MLSILKELFAVDSVWARELGLFIIRVGVGIVYIRHGYPKLLKGPEEWLWLGQQMGNLGIHFAPLMWGIAASCAEFFGGISLALGLGTRIASVFLAFTMFVATVMHITKGDSWGYISYPLAMMIVFIGLLFAGSGSWSLDWYLYNKWW